MSDDFGTVNVSRADRAREIDELRQHYRRHRESLHQLAADAPTERFAAEYNRLIAEMDAALAKVDDLQPGMRPLVPPPRGADGIADYDAPRSSRSPLVLIVVAALLALAAIAWLIWKPGSDRNKANAIADRPAATTSASSTTAPSTVVEQPAVVSVLTATPASADYGTIRKGTRATRQFTVRNESEQPVTMQVGRSACRCLYYEYVALIPPKAKETVTVTIDGARAKAGTLHESVKVTAKNDPSVATSFDVTANIQ
ncbi:MAG: hypothetical protein DMF56_02000 [Acidobacteria bacterium]|nr:MAG: hypothetical protein DMF56_02000 [Acidobacteriota bacterium]